MPSVLDKLKDCHLTKDSAPKFIKSTYTYTYMHMPGQIGCIQNSEC